MKISFISRLSTYTLSSGHRLLYPAEQGPFRKLVKEMSFLPFRNTKKREREREREKGRKKENKKERWKERKKEINK